MVLDKLQEGVLQFVVLKLRLLVLTLVFIVTVCYFVFEQVHIDFELIWLFIATWSDVRWALLGFILIRSSPHKWCIVVRLFSYGICLVIIVILFGAIEIVLIGRLLKWLICNIVFVERCLFEHWFLCSNAISNGFKFNNQWNQTNRYYKLAVLNYFLSLFNNFSI